MPHQRGERRKRVIHPARHQTRPDDERRSHMPHSLVEIGCHLLVDVVETVGKGSAGPV